MPGSTEAAVEATSETSISDQHSLLIPQPQQILPM